ncbi:hypothetical protein LA080_008845 [Diaporthe eres]|nr:hypothetical protein LA080_008845 [Diaporthe eres]
MVTSENPKALVRQVPPSDTAQGHCDFPQPFYKDTWPVESELVLAAAATSSQLDVFLYCPAHHHGTTPQRPESDSARPTLEHQSHDHHDAFQPSHIYAYRSPPVITTSSIGELEKPESVTSRQETSQSICCAIPLHQNSKSYQNHNTQQSLPPPPSPSFQRSEDRVGGVLLEFHDVGFDSPDEYMADLPHRPNSAFSCCSTAHSQRTWSLHRPGV